MADADVLLLLQSRVLATDPTFHSGWLLVVSHYIDRHRWPRTIIPVLVLWQWPQHLGILEELKMKRTTHISCDIEHDKWYGAKKIHGFILLDTVLMLRTKLSICAFIVGSPNVCAALVAPHPTVNDRELLASAQVLSRAMSHRTLNYTGSKHTFGQESFFVQNTNGIQAKQRRFNQWPQRKHDSFVSEDLTVVRVCESVCRPNQGSRVQQS